MLEEPSHARSETRRLAAIMFTDIVGFSRQMGNYEARMLRLLREATVTMLSLSTQGGGEYGAERD
jgi:class 3 adenylate cyclase